MAGIGIVSNPRARRNRRHPGTAGALARLLGGDGLLLDAATPEALALALQRIRGAGADVLAVNGGDGTAHRVLTALPALWPPPLPRLLHLRGGSMNTAAGSLGVRGTPEAVLARVLRLRRAGASLPAVERDLLGVEADGHPRLVGFLFGTGAAVAFLEAWYGRPHPSRLSALLLLARAAFSAIAGGPLAAALTRREAMRAAADGEDWPADAFLAVMAGAIREVGFGFAPLGRCDEQPGCFHAVGVTGTAAQLAMRLPAVRLGLPWRRPLAVDSVARELVLDAGGPLRFTVDGDLYRAEGEVRVTAGPVVEVVVP
jgi:hypothetical protein